MAASKADMDLVLGGCLMNRAVAVMLAAMITGTVGPVSAQTAAPAQTPAPAAIAEDFKPSSVNQPGQQYPQVNSQGHARFRIVAPEAQSVKVSLGLGGRGGTVLTKAADGSWTCSSIRGCGG